MSPLGKQVHKVYSSKYIERCKYSLICIFLFLFMELSERKWFYKPYTVSTRLTA